MRRILGVGILTAVLLATSIVPSASASNAVASCGCGGVVAPVDVPISASSERAIISWDGQRERIELTFDIDSEALTAGMIIPTPQPPVVSAGDLRTFDVIESTIAPSVTVEKDWWGIDLLNPGHERSGADDLPRINLSGTQSIQLLASDSAGLNNWLLTNGFAMSDDMARAIRTYADFGWTFTLLTFSSAEMIDGHIDPIRLTFDTQRLVYPMRLARSESTPQNVRLYVFDDHRNDVTQAAAPTLNIDGKIEELYAGKVTDSRLASLGGYLSAFDITFDDPKEQVTSDIGFFQSVRDTDFTPSVVEYRPVTLFGIPLGSLLVAWGVLGAALLIGHFRGRRRAR